MTDQQQEFGPWFQHDGKGCPCVGQWVMAERRNGDVDEWRAMTRINPTAVGTTWEWGTSRPWFRGLEVIRYRIKRPRALLDLIQLIADLPAPVAPIKTDGVIA